MTCRHAKGDPNCSSTAGSSAWYESQKAYESTAPKTPDAENYTIEAVDQVGTHLVLRVRYPNCRACSYEGVKVLVYLNVSTLAAMRWRKIDPHFADLKTTRGPTEAPGPNARFPAGAEGWADALAYAASKRTPVTRTADPATLLPR